MNVRLFALVALLGGCPSEDAAPAMMVSELGAAPAESELTRRFQRLGKNATWTLVDRIPMGFPTYHTQGLVKIGDDFYVSSVEVLESTQRNGTSTDALRDFGTDRSEGKGRGWLFRFDRTGALVARRELTAGSIYHPGGIDFDGRHLWVPVAEYRPNSRSHVYRVDPATLEAELALVVADHLGGVVHDVERGTLHGVSWGSRRLYTWPDDDANAAGSWTVNPSFYVDYQDCHYAGPGHMLCGGVGSYAVPGGASIAFGGLDLVDLRDGRPRHQVPVNVFVDEGKGPGAGLALTHNPFWAEPAGDEALRFYFMPESDNQAELLVYEATPWGVAR
ncbi:MAG: DUF6454 family protein [Polyangiales bacterium]